MEESSSPIITYVQGEPNAECTKWLVLDELRFELEPGEFTLIWAANNVRRVALEEAEKKFPGYSHKEVFNLGGERKVIGIGSATEVMGLPLLIGQKGAKDSPEIIKAIREDERLGQTLWRTPREVGLQLLASLGWFADLSKSGAPPISKNQSEVIYASDVFPSNIQITKEEAPSGFNEKQLGFLKKGKELMTQVLKGIESLEKTWIDISVLEFSYKVFRTTSKLYGALPDLEEEERKRLEELKELAKQKEEQSEDE